MHGLYEAAFVERLRRHVEQLCPRWGLAASSRVTPLCLSENATFLAVDARQPVPIVVRVHRPGYHEFAEIAAELAWIDALREDSVVNTPEPLAMTDGSRIATVREGALTLYLVAFAFMPGREPSVDEALAPWFERTGAIAARLHAHARGWSRPTGFRRRSWNLETIVGDVPHWGRWQDAPGLAASERVMLDRAVRHLRDRIEPYGQTAARFGLVHADLRLANLLISGNDLGVLDFDDCGFGWFMSDVAAAVSFIEERPDIPSLLAAWCKGYRAVTPLGEEEAAMLPLFVMLRRLQLTAWLASRPETDTARALGREYPAGTVRLARRLLASGTPFG